MQLAPAVSLVVYALAVARVTGLITADQITAGLRKRITERLAPGDDPPKGWRAEAFYLMTCSWCVSIYVGVVGAVLWFTVGNNPVLLVCAVAAAFSQLTGMVSDVGRG